MRYFFFSLTIGLLLVSSSSHAQYSLGMTGLLTIPTADMQPDGTFMGGGNFLPEELTPAKWDYDTGSYFVNMTFLPFLEIGYRCTLFHREFENGNKWQQDRSVSLRVRPLKEGKWWPSLVMGSNDAFTTGKLNTFSNVTGNRYFSSVYMVATKHFLSGGHDLALTLGGNIPFRNGSYRKGVFGGMSYSPAFLKPVILMAEYDAEAVSVGAAALLFNHISLYAFCYDFKAVAGGVRYEFKCWK